MAMRKKTFADTAKDRYLFAFTHVQFPESGRCEKKGITIGGPRWSTRTMRRSSSHNNANVKWDNDHACNESGSI